MKNLHDYRKSYEKHQLLETGLPDEPMGLFADWFTDADKIAGLEANAMTLSTTGTDGFPQARIVLMKEFNAEGFVFFTNYRSDKGKAMAADPRVCLSFFWHLLERQVIVKGIATKTSPEVSTAYFDSRPQGSKLGAHVSIQSSVVESREMLDEKLKALEAEMTGKQIPRPEHWGGYKVRPESIEFWQGRANRLHDRIRFRRNGESWVVERLAP
jgi:pyridoxamine 5'-phosphate oxidase